MNKKEKSSLIFFLRMMVYKLLLDSPITLGIGFFREEERKRQMNFEMCIFC